MISSRNPLFASIAPHRMTACHPQATFDASCGAVMPSAVAVNHQLNFRLLVRNSCKSIALEYRPDNSWPLTRRSTGLASAAGIELTHAPLRPAYRRYLSPMQRTSTPIDFSPATTSLNSSGGMGGGVIETILSPPPAILPIGGYREAEREPERLPARATPCQTRLPAPAPAAGSIRRFDAVVSCSPRCAE
jgi:hypothetical protein